MKIEVWPSFDGGQFVNRQIFTPKTLSMFWQIRKLDLDQTLANTHRVNVFANRGKLPSHNW